MYLVRVVTCTAKKETTPPTHTFTHTHRHTHSPLNPNHPGLQCVCDGSLNPLETPLPVTDAQRRTRSYCGLIQTENNVKHDDMKRTHTHTLIHTVLMDRLNEPVPTNTWLQTESGQKPVKGIVALN